MTVVDFYIIGVFFLMFDARRGLAKMAILYHIILRVQP